MNITTEQLLQKIGLLAIENDMLRTEINKLKQETVKKETADLE